MSKFLWYPVVYQSTLQSVTVSSLLRQAPSFFGHFSHDTRIVALSFSFLNVLKLCCLVLFSWRKLQKRKKKTQHFSKSFSSYLHNRSTSEHNSNRFRKLQQRTTTQIFGPCLVIGHVTTIPTHQVDPNRQNHSHLVFLHFWSNKVSFPFWGRP